MKKFIPMKLQLDTTVQIHRLMNPPNDQINSELTALRGKAESVSASTYSKKEFAFSLIRDCCTMLTRIHRTKSLKDALDFIDRYGCKKIRFRSRMLSVFWKFMIGETIRGELVKCDSIKRDRILGQEFEQFLRVCIPAFWESFEEGLDLPLQDRTKCPFAHIAPIDNGATFDFTIKRKCNPSYNCALPNLIHGEHKRALKLLERLRSLEVNRKTDELKNIELVVETFFERTNEEVCYEMCNKGIGDLIIALETLPDRTLVTTNAKESDVISPAIEQEYVVLTLRKN